MFLKGDRCYTDKCAVDRRAYAPGQHGQRRSKFSEYGQQLREKQKVRRIYGLLEKQFHHYFEQADRMKGVTGENLLTLVEQRLDNIVYRLGFTATRTEARHLVRHGHFTVNGRKVNIPSYQVVPGDVIEVREKSRKMARIVDSLEASGRRGLPAFLELNPQQFKGTMKMLPKREDVALEINEQLIVEFYSR